MDHTLRGKHQYHRSQIPKLGVKHSGHLLPPPTPFLTSFISSSPPLLYSRQTPPSPRDTLLNPLQRSGPTISLASKACMLLLAVQIFLPCNPSLPIRTIVFLTGRAAFQSCGTQGNKPRFLRKCQNQGLFGRQRPGPPPSI